MHSTLISSLVSLTRYPTRYTSLIKTESSWGSKTLEVFPQLHRCLQHSYNAIHRKKLIAGAPKRQLILHLTHFYCIPLIVNNNNTIAHSFQLKSFKCMQYTQFLHVCTYHPVLRHMHGCVSMFLFLVVHIKSLLYACVSILAYAQWLVTHAYIIICAIIKCFKST